MIDSNKTEINVKVSAIALTINCLIADDINNFLEYSKNFYIMRDLKRYRPARKPVLDSYVFHPDLFSNEVLLNKRKLLVRDWFFFVVWSMRLKNMMRTVY
jgi:hypothetical protein